MLDKHPIYLSNLLSCTNRCYNSPSLIATYPGFTQNYTTSFCLHTDQAIIFKTHTHGAKSQRNFKLLFLLWIVHYVQSIMNNPAL